MSGKHPDKDVSDAFVKLSDALVTWERNTSRRSVLIFREQGGIEIRLADGRPAPDGFSDSELFDGIDWTREVT